MGDGTGPAGMGPMTGRAAGYCAGYLVPGFNKSLKFYRKKIKYPFYGEDKRKC
jgi:hypothetical protein